MFSKDQKLISINLKCGILCDITNFHRFVPKKIFFQIYSSLYKEIYDVLVHNTENERFACAACSSLWSVRAGSAFSVNYEYIYKLKFLEKIIL